MTAFIEYSGEYKIQSENNNWIFCLIAGKKELLRKDGDKLSLRVDIEEEVETFTDNECTLIISGLAEKLNYRTSGGDFGHSFYKKIDGKKFRISDHATTAKWAGVYGYSDEEIIIHSSLSKTKVVCLIEKLGFNINELIEIGNRIRNDNFFKNIELQQRINAGF